MTITNAIFTKSIAVIGLLTNPVVFALDVPAGEITSARARALVGVAFGLISVVIGAVTLLRSKNRTAAIVASVLGVIGVVLSVMHLAGNTGGFGTGGGRAGAIVALVLSLVGIALGGRIMLRARTDAASATG
jgi:hypothetical protein